MRKVQADVLNGKIIRTAVEREEELVVFDGDEPVARLVPVTIELRAREQYFVHWPHDPQECLFTCWRHPRPAPVPVGPAPDREKAASA